MSPFFVFVVIGLLFFLGLLRHRPKPGEEIQYTFRVLFIILAILLIFAFYLLLFTASVRVALDESLYIKDVFANEDVGSAAFGFGFGIFAGYWFSIVLYRNPRAQTATLAEKVAFATMGVLLILGIVGQKALNKAFAHLTTVEVAGTKLGFSPAAKDEVIFQQMPSGAPADHVPGHPQGLALASQLADLIDRDRVVFELANNVRYGDASTSQAAQVSSRETSDNLDKLSQRIDYIFKPLLSCVEAYYDFSRDDTRIAELLRPLTVELRREAHLSEKPNDRNLLDNYWRIAATIIHENPERHRSEDCKVLKTLTQTKVEQTINDLRGGGWQDSPYLYIFASDFLAYGKQYPAAIQNLRRWIDCYAETKDLACKSRKDRSIDPTMAQIYLIRVRGALVPIIEEWLHGANVGPPNPSLQKFQLQNLTDQISVFETSSKLMRLLGAVEPGLHSTKGQPEDDVFFVAPHDWVACAKPSEDGLTKSYAKGLGQRYVLLLERSLIGAKLNWITVATDNPDTFRSRSATARKYIRDLWDIDLSCLAEEAPAAERKLAVVSKRVDILDAYARIALGEHKIHAGLAAHETEKSRLDKALRALQLAEDLLADLAEQNSETEKADIEASTADQYLFEIASLKQRIKQAEAEASR